MPLIDLLIISVLSQAAPSKLPPLPAAAPTAQAPVVAAAPAPAAVPAPVAATPVAAPLPTYAVPVPPQAIYLQPQAPVVYMGSPQPMAAPMAAPVPAYYLAAPAQAPQVYQAPAIAQAPVPAQSPLTALVLSNPSAWRLLLGWLGEGIQACGAKLARNKQPQLVGMATVAQAPQLPQVYQTPQVYQAPVASYMISPVAYQPAAAPVASHWGSVTTPIVPAQAPAPTYYAGSSSPSGYAPGSGSPRMAPLEAPAMITTEALAVAIDRYEQAKAAALAVGVEDFRYATLKAKQIEQEEALTLLLWVHGRPVVYGERLYVARKDELFIYAASGHYPLGTDVQAEYLRRAHTSRQHRSWVRKRA